MKQFNIVAFLVFLAALAWVFVLKPESIASLRSTFLGWYSPVIKASGAAHGDGVEEDLRPRGELLSEIEALRVEVGRLHILEKELVDIKTENDELHRDLDYLRRVDFQLIPARVIKRTRSSWWSVVTINRGRVHGVEKDLAVITEKGIVGKTTGNGLTDTTAEVLLLTDEQCAVPAQVGSHGVLQGLARGERGLSNIRPQVLLTLLEKGHNLPAGAIVYTSRDSNIYPQGFVIGRAVNEREGEITNSAVIESAVDFTNLSSVFVYKGDARDVDAPPSDATTAKAAEPLNAVTASP